MGIRAFSLQSGSNGNCICVEAGGKRLLFDAGIPGVRAESRLRDFGLDIRDFDALIISHDHSDHVRYAGVYQRKYGLPLYASRGTLESALSRHPIGRLGRVELFSPGQTLGFSDVSVHTFPTHHDGAEGSAFVVSWQGRRLGILTDLGHASDGLRDVVASLDAVFMESNYDPDMLSSGPYPAFLKRRIKGPGGHLSNPEAAELLASAGGRLRWVCLSHLSEKNNHPALAIETHHRALGREMVIFAASRHRATPTPGI